MRNEDYDRELLVIVALVCAALAVLVSLIETTTSIANTKSQAPVRVEHLEPVLLIDRPSITNTKPGER